VAKKPCFWRHQALSEAKRFRVNFPLHALLESPTIKASTARLAEFDCLTTDEDADLARLVREIGDMSEEEAQRLLASDKQ
jgi:hypothetical protein